MTNQSDSILIDINANLINIKESLKEEIHKISLELVEVRSDIKSINNVLGNRVERLEAEQATHDHHIMLMKDDLHRHDTRINELKNEHKGTPEEIQKQRHRLNAIDQRVVILEKHNSYEEQERFRERLADAEKILNLMQEKSKGIDELKKSSSDNTKAIEGQKTIIKFITSKPVWAIVMFVSGVLLASFSTTGGK